MFVTVVFVVVERQNFNLLIEGLHYFVLYFTYGVGPL